MNAAHSAVFQRFVHDALPPVGLPCKGGTLTLWLALAAVPDVLLFSYGRVSITFELWIDSQIQKALGGQRTPVEWAAVPRGALDRVFKALHTPFVPRQV